MRGLRFLLVAVAVSALGGAVLSQAEDTAMSPKAAMGKEIAFRRSGDSGVGNCLACHAMAGAESPGDMGPALVQIKVRFPDRKLLRQRVYDATQFNPISAMPPFGKHRILTEEEIDAVVEYLYTL